MYTYIYKYICIYPFEWKMFDFDEKKKKESFIFSCRYHYISCWIINVNDDIHKKKICFHEPRFYK